VFEGVGRDEPQLTQSDCAAGGGGHNNTPLE